APLLTVPHQMFEAVAKLPLVAIPFFMLTGELMNSSVVTERILDLARAIVGSAVADTATIGTVLIPAMKKAGYTAEYSAAVTAVATTIGGIIPPSIAM